MTTVACVLRSGGVYTPDWALRLKRSVARHTNVDYKFVCLTDWHFDGCATYLLEHEWSGWWAKMELFRPDLFSGRVVYFDLDTLILGSIDGLLRYDGPFATLRDFYHPDVSASGVMAWDGSNAPDLYGRYQADGCPTRGRSDLWWNQYANPRHLQDLFPDTFASYKAHRLREGPKGYPVVCFHGTPNQIEAGGWATEAWEALAA